MTVPKSTAVFAAVLAATSLLASSAFASTILVSGYTDSLVASIGGTQLYGAIAVDSSGNSYVTKGGSVLKVSSAGVVSTFATIPVGTPISLDVVGNNLFVGTGSNTMYKVALASGAVSAAATASGALNGLTSSLDGNSLFTATTVGVGRYNVASNAFSTTALGATIYTGIATRADGKILVSAYNYGATSILAYDPLNNTSSVFYSGLSQIGALAIDPVTGDVYAASEATNKVVRINAAGTTAVDFAAIGMDAGYYPTALTFSADGKSLYYLESVSNAVTLRQISGFAGLNAVPEPATWALFGVALAGLAFFRRKRA